MGHKQVFAAILLLCPAALGQSSSPVGRWVGSFDSDGHRALLAGSIRRQGNGISLSAQVIPGAGNVELACTVQGERIQFSIPWQSGHLDFQGEMRNGSIEGTVVGAKSQGKFALLRTANMPPSLLSEYSGAYEFDENEVIFIRRQDEWDGDPETFEVETVLDYVRESGVNGTLHPKSQSEFFSGPTSLTPNPVKIRVQFVRGDDGTVTGMEWNEGGVKRHLPRSTRYRKENVVGLWGISEGGGWTGPLAAAEDGKVAFLIAVSPPATSRADLERLNAESLLKAKSDVQRKKALRFFAQRDRYAHTLKGWESLRHPITDLQTEPWFSNTTAAIYGANKSDHWYWNWWEKNRLYAPIATWKRVKCPTLLIWGGLDDTVPPQIHRDRLSTAGIDNVQEKFFPRGGHVLIEQRTNDMWSDLPYVTRLSPGYFEAMVGWLRQQAQ